MRVAFIRQNIKPVLSTWQDDCSSFCQLWDHVFISLYLDSQPWHARENTLYLFSSSLQEIHSCFCYNQELLFFPLGVDKRLTGFLPGRKKDYMGMHENHQRIFYSELPCHSFSCYFAYHNPAE